eukprot:6201129-Pleurochrysis_carterae.AAC.1
MKLKEQDNGAERSREREREQKGTNERRANEEPKPAKASDHVRGRRERQWMETMRIKQKPAL